MLWIGLAVIEMPSRYFDFDFESIFVDFLYALAAILKQVSKEQYLSGTVFKNSFIDSLE